MSERERIERLKGFSESFMKAHKCLEKGSKGYEFMEGMTHFLEVSFEKRLPLSEDLLFLSLRWNTITNNMKLLESSLWKCLEKVLTRILAIPMKDIAWEWFKANLFHSAVQFYPPFLRSFFFWLAKGQEVPSST